MPQQVTSLADRVARVSADIRSRLELEGPLLRRATADILAAVFAGAIHELEVKDLGPLARALFASTAQGQDLLDKAAFYGIFPAAATFATGSVTATGTNGSVVPAETILVVDGDQRYRVTAGGTVASGTVTVTVEAVLAGEAGNQEAGAPLVPESPVTGVDSDSFVVAAGGLTNGNDQQDVEAVRTRLLLNRREPPQGGADQDYIAWALAVPGVTRVWIFDGASAGGNGPGTVVVRFVRDGDASIFPDAGEVTAVQTYLDSQRPVTAEVTAAAPTSLAVDFTFTSLSPNTAEVQAAIEAELADLLLREGEPGDGSGRGTIRLSAIRTAVGLAEGLDDYVMSVPSANVVPGIGQLPQLGTVTFP